MADRPAGLVSPAVGAVLHVIVWTVVAGAVVCLALQAAGEAVGWMVTPPQALTPWVVPLPFAAAVLAVFLGRYPAAGVAAVLGTVLVAVIGPMMFAGGLPPAAGDRVTITHANLLYGNERIDDAIEALAATDADIVAVSELTPEFADAFAASELARSHPYSVVRPGDAATGLGVWSRLPLLAGERSRDGAMALTVQVQLDDRPLQVVLAHPLPPIFDPGRWRREMEALADRPAAERDRTVLVADLNVSYVNPPFRRFLDETGYRDAHRALGRGLTMSWPTDELFPAFVRLDHALVGRHVTATAIDDVDVPGSDHRGFTVTVAWAAP
jgi:endonuclease/exonuclease/phosphatase (EEP) superfamily protein YafD